MRPPQGFEWLLILFIILLLFGAKRLPDMARSVGKSLRILKAETRELSEDGGPTAKPTALTGQADAPPAPGTDPGSVPPSAQQGQPQADKPTL
jgi:sec-independent protein translocase protein TatA